jgi:hypothetical protein
MIGTHLLFALCIHYMLSMKHAIIYLEIDQNKKYKYMFDFIQDAVLLVEGSELKFANQFAYEICDYQLELETFKPLHEKQFLYMFQFHEESGEDG